MGIRETRRAFEEVVGIHAKSRGRQITAPLIGLLRCFQAGKDVGRCSGCASGELIAVDRWLSGPYSHSSAQAVIINAVKRDHSRIPSGHCGSTPTWVGDVVLIALRCDMDGQGEGVGGEMSEL